MIIGLVAGNMVALPQAFVLLLGTNIGTTVQVPVLRDLVHASFLLAGLVSFFVWMIATRTDQKNTALSVIGTALVFSGLSSVIAGLEGLTQQLWFTETLRLMKEGTSAIFHGITLTALLQSSGVSLGVVAEFLRAGILLLPAALYFMFGANIGTTITAVISAIGSTIDAKRTAILHVLINLAGVLLFWPVLWLLLRAGTLNALSASPDRVLMTAHLLFNLISALLFLPLTGRFVQLARFLVPPPVERRTAKAQEIDAGDSSLLLLRTDFQALFRTIWAYTQQVFHLYQSMDITQIERTAQIRDNIEQTRSALRQDFFRAAGTTDLSVNDTGFMLLISKLEDMEILYNLTHDVFTLASDRIMHRRQADPVSRVALRSQFKKTLDMVYLCAQLDERDPEEVNLAIRNQEEIDRAQTVYARNALMAVRDGGLDAKNAEDLLSVFRLLERMNLAGRMLLERDDAFPLDNARP